MTSTVAARGDRWTWLAGEGLVLREVAPGHTVDEVVGLTDAPLIVDEALKASAGKED